MECCSSMFVFQCSFGAGVSVVLSGLERFQAFPHPHCFFVLHSTDLINVDGCLEWRLMAGLWGFASHGQYSISGLAGHSGRPWTPQAPAFHLSEAAVN